MTRHPKKCSTNSRGPQPLQWYLPPGRCNHQDHRNSHQDHWWVQDTPGKNKIQITMDKKSSNNDLTFVVCLLLTRKCGKHWALTSSPEKQREHWRLRSRHCHKHNRLVLHPNHLLHSPGEFSPSQTCSLWFLWFCDIMSCAFFTVTWQQKLIHEVHLTTPKLLGPQSYPNRCSNRWHNSLWISGGWGDNSSEGLQVSVIFHMKNGSFSVESLWISWKSRTFFWLGCFPDDVEKQMDFFADISRL